MLPPWMQVLDGRLLNSGHLNITPLFHRYGGLFSLGGVSFSSSFVEKNYPLAVRDIIQKKRKTKSAVSILKNKYSYRISGHSSQIWSSPYRMKEPRVEKFVTGINFSDNYLAPRHQTRINSIHGSNNSMSIQLIKGKRTEWTRGEYQQVMT